MKAGPGVGMKFHDELLRCTGVARNPNSDSQVAGCPVVAQSAVGAASEEGRLWVLVCENFALTEDWRTSFLPFSRLWIVVLVGQLQGRSWRNDIPRFGCGGAFSYNHGL